jgi:hypothetical protein
MLTEKYSQLADELIEIVNATPLRIEYNRTVANPTSTPFGLSEDNIGNPNYIENMYNRIDQQGVVENVGNFQEVTCRAYWNAKDLNFPLEFKNDPDICKIITYTTDKIVQEPIPYGFGKRYSESYARKVKEVGE